jgi:hypothetical protein
MAADRLPAGFVNNREIAESTSDPISASKLQHLYKGTGVFFNDLGGRPRTFQIGTRAKIGATAGFAVGAADNLPYVATCPASQTGSTLIIPIDGLNIGDVITGFKVVAQVESAGGAVTIDGDLRATTNVAAEPTDASIGTMTQVSVTADTAVSQEKTGLTEIVTSGKTYYLKLTATTAAATDIIVQACEITVIEGLRTRTIILFVADKAGTLEDIAAGLDETGTSTSITVDVQKRPSTSLLSSTISLTNSIADRAEQVGTISGTGSYAAGDVIIAVVTVTSATGAAGLWVRYTRKENND